MHTETDILILLKDKDELALSCLYDEYAPALYGIITKLIPDPDAASDILHESFVKIWLDMDDYNASKGSLFNWMIRVTVKQCHEASGQSKKVILHKLRPAGSMWKVLYYRLSWFFFNKQRSAAW